MAKRNFDLLTELLEQRIVFLDGAMGTMVQGHELGEADYRGERFADSTIELKGNHDLLSITRPDIIRGIHTAFLDAGADVIETNTFNGNAPALADYGLEEWPGPGCRGLSPAYSGRRIGPHRFRRMLTTPVFAISRSTNSPRHTQKVRVHCSRAAPISCLLKRYSIR